MGTEATSTFLLDRKWPFRIAVASWLVIGVGAWFLADNLDRPGQVILGGLWVVGLALLLRQFILSLFGPVLAFDVLRVGRRPRQLWFRVAYVILLALLFTWVYITWWEVRRRGSIVRPRELAELAEMYFSVFMVVQFILVCLLTPASVAGAIAEEKERRTLEFLLATDLRDREILFGKLASRVGSLMLFLLAGLPVLGLLQFFGGIDPELVLAGFVATIMLVLSLAAISIAASVMSRKARDAIALTYLLAVAYVLASGIVYVLFTAPPLRWTVDVIGYSIASEDIAYPFVTGNPFFMVPYILETRGRGGIDLFTALGHFTLFHAIVIALFVGWAGWRLRAIALVQMFGGGRRPLLRRIFPRRVQEKATASRSRRPAKTSIFRPEVGNSPVLWKEVFVDTGLRLSGFGRLVVLGLIALSFVPAGFVFWFTIVDPGPWASGRSWAGRWDDFGQGMNAYLRAAGTVAASLVFLAVAIRGAGAISGERDRHTWDALLTTPLSAKAIVWGKWWGCILGMRWAWAWIFGIWMLCMAAGGVHPVMFPAAVISVAVYASGFAWIGLFCSLHCRTTLRSTMAAILMSVFCGGGYFLVFVLCCVIPLSFDRSMSGDVGDVITSFFCSFSPSVNLAWLPIREFHRREVDWIDGDIPYAPFWILGLLAWGGLSFILSNACINKFRQIANRQPTAPVREVWPKRLPPPLPKRATPR
jgi:ABC-type transport system involved in multi-copper enzyme maturation permease subunit